MVSNPPAELTSKNPAISEFTKISEDIRTFIVHKVKLLGQRKSLIRGPAILDIFRVVWQRSGVTQSIRGIRRISRFRTNTISSRENDRDPSAVISTDRVRPAAILNRNIQIHLSQILTARVGH
jgi:hypothetical protein